MKRFFRKRPWLVQGIRSVFSLFGLDIHLKHPTVFDFLALHSVGALLDVGAHTGQFASEIRKRFPSATIHSFEPNPRPYRELKDSVAHDPLWAAYNIAIGAKQEERELLVTTSEPSSSFLPLGVSQVYSPEIQVVSREHVHVVSLDAWAPDLQLTPPILLKVDVQGFEAEVIRGATEILPSVSMAVLEVSFEPLYLGQPLYDEIHELMRRHDFRLKGMYGVSHHNDSKRQLWADAVFVKNGFLRKEESTSAHPASLDNALLRE